MSVELESRPTPAPTQSSPTFRQTGFSVPPTSTSSTQDVNATAAAASKAPRGKLSNSSLNAALHARVQSGSLGRVGEQRAPDDEDAEMTEANETSSLHPFPIPGKTGAIALISKASQSPSNLATPPDAMSLKAHKPSPGLSTSGVRLPPLNSNLISPRFSTLHGSSVSSGPASATSSHWSPGRSSDPHLYRISSGRKYSYTSFKPSLGTSFKMSAERGRSSNTFDDDDDDDDDVVGSFGKRSGALGLLSDRKTADRGTPVGDLGEDGDASGVFSFSSPCFGPKQLDNDQVPSPDPNEELPATSGSATGNVPSGVLSPSWATASLGKLSLGSPEARTSISSQLRRGSRPQHGHSYGQTNHATGSMSTSADVAVHAAMQQRRYSYNKAARPSLAPGPSSYTYSTSFGRDAGISRHPYARASVSGSYGAAGYCPSRSRSRNRQGAGEDARAAGRLDDDGTDEEMQLDKDDDDATEDEADYAHARHQAGRSVYSRSIPRAVNDRSRSNTPANASLGLTFQMSPGSGSLLGKGLPLDANGRSSSSSIGVSLSRQYSSDRHPPGVMLAPHRHHPYATSPSGATAGPLSASMGLSYSPGSNAPLNRPPHRRGSSLGNGLAVPGFNGAMLSTSPRYASTSAHRLPGDDPQPGEGGSYLGQSPFASGSPFAAGQRMDSAGKYYTPARGSSYGHGHAQAHAQHYAAARNGSLTQSPPAHLQQPQQHGQHERAGQLLYAGFGTHERSDSMASEATEGPDSGVRPSTIPASVPARSNSNTGASGNVDETAQVAAIRDRLGGAASCSAFISKLWLLMINPDLYSKYIRWDEAGTSIILSSEPDIANEFASDVLPKLFKHGNNASFVRQLNLYGFQRIPSSRLLDPTEIKIAAARRSAESGGAGKAEGAAGTLNTAVQLYGAHSSFAHPRFRRGHEELLPTMKPRSSKKPKKSNGSTVAVGLSPPKGGIAAGRPGDGDETNEEEYALS